MEQRIGIERMEEAINLFGPLTKISACWNQEFQVTVVNRAASW